MSPKPQVDSKFTMRRDSNNIRVVFLLGNEEGDCRYRCRFCTCRSTPKVSPAENMREFERQLIACKNSLTGPYHPLIYNEGNATDPDMFSRQNLQHVLAAFQGDVNVIYVSINSREAEATDELLCDLVAMRLTYPIHFILGIESFSRKLPHVLGKDTAGEMERFIKKLKPFNVDYKGTGNKLRYHFGLDVNLVFLPELYLDEGQPRHGNDSSIISGIKSDVRGILKRLDPLVPVEINIHPFTKTPTLEYEDVELDLLMEVLPELQQMIEVHCQSWSARVPHLFIGVEGKGYGGSAWAKRLKKWRPIIDVFNATGRISG